MQISGYQEFASDKRNTVDLGVTIATPCQGLNLHNDCLDNELAGHIGPGGPCRQLSHLYIS